MPISNVKKLELDLEQGKVMKCPNCKEVVSIRDCKWVDRVSTTLKTIKELNSILSKKIVNVSMSKNGTIQKMHKLVGQLFDLMDDDQLKKAKEINLVMKEEIKRWEKEIK